MTRTQQLFTDYRNGMNEGGEGYNPHADTLRQERQTEDIDQEAAAEAEWQARRAQENAEWTREITAQRRAEFNAWVRAHGGKITPDMLLERSKAVGYGGSVIKHHVIRHGL